MIFMRCIVFAPLFFILSVPFIARANDIVHLSRYAFKYSAQTKASKETIWALWADVENWPAFDERLDYAYLVDDKHFKHGAVGYLKGKNAPKTKFEITAFEAGKSFSERLHIPLYQSVDLLRYFEDNEHGQTVFTHEVRFRGRLSPLMYTLLARPFKKDIKLVVERVKDIAEGEDDPSR